MKDTELFKKYQKQLVWFINTKVGRWFFKVDKEIKGITEVTPNSLTYGNYYHKKDGEWREIKTTCFRTNNKYARLLNYRLAPLHKLALLLPSLARPELGPFLVPVMLTVDTYYPNADGDNNPVDGIAWVASKNESWASLIAEAGNNSNYTDSPQYVLFIQSTSTTNQWQRLHRMIVLFNTASLPDTDNIDSAVLSLYGTAKGDSFTTPINADYNIYASTPASNTAVANGDFTQVGSTAFATAVAYADLSTSAYTDFAFNASGIAAISKTGISKFGGRNANYDVAASAPTWSSSKLAYWLVDHAESTGTSYDPKLTVTHSAAITFIPQIIFS